MRRGFCRAVASVLATVVITSGVGCATSTPPAEAAVRMKLAALSPEAEVVPPRETWSRAEAYADAHAGCEVLVGRGNSMLPVYQDRTVLVVERLAMGKLQSGMTVIFTGQRGWPVAHVLLEKGPRGWRTMGLGNDEPDLTTVRHDNYIGIVVKAYAPVAPSVVARVTPAETNAAGI